MQEVKVIPKSILDSTLIKPQGHSLKQGNRSQHLKLQNY